MGCPQPHFVHCANVVTIDYEPPSGCSTAHRDNPVVPDAIVHAYRNGSSSNREDGWFHGNRDAQRVSIAGCVEHRHLTQRTHVRDARPVRIDDGGDAGEKRIAGGARCEGRGGEMRGRQRQRTAGVSPARSQMTGSRGCSEQLPIRCPRKRVNGTVRRVNGSLRDREGRRLDPSSKHD